MDNSKTGCIIHVELPARDLDEAAAFFTGLFGWQINASPGYVGFKPSHGPSGGFNSLTGSEAKMPIRPGDVLVYVACDDIDPILEKVEIAGGQIVTPRSEIPGAGWFAVFTDPTGNRIGLLHFVHEQ